VRLLISTPYPIGPPTHGGRVRVAGLAAGLAAAGAEVTLLAPWHPARQSGHAPEGVSLRRHVLAANVLPAVVPERLASPQALLSLQPRAWGPRRLLDALGGFDVHQFDFCAQAQWLDLLPSDAAVVYSSHNVEADFVSVQHRPARLARIARRRIERLERQAAQRADLVLACTQADATRMDELYRPARTTVVPNGPQATSFASPRRDEMRLRLGLDPDELAVLFVGGDSAHNREAARFLADEVAPRMGDGVRLVLAGRCSNGSGSRGGRVTKLGWVDDLPGLLAAADVGVNPVAAAGGSSVKVADFLAAGLPVVATPEGARGTHAGGGVTIVSRERFADEVAGRRPPPANGCPPSWAQLGEGLLAEYEDLLRSRRR
jgi:glycosyltransferase involved in cell wall biosynthesis